MFEDNKNWEPQIINNPVVGVRLAILLRLRHRRIALVVDAEDLLVPVHC